MYRFVRFMIYRFFFTIYCLRFVFWFARACGLCRRGLFCWFPILCGCEGSLFTMVIWGFLGPSGILLCTCLLLYHVLNRCLIRFLDLRCPLGLLEAECPVAWFGMSAPHLGLGWAREQGVVSLCMAVVHMRVHV